MQVRSSCIDCFPDAFYNPPYWANYDPTDSSAQTPAEHLTVDTHQFWAFPPFLTMTGPEIIQAICQFGQELRAPKTGIPPTLVGEWSLSTGKKHRSPSRRPGPLTIHQVSRRTQPRTPRRTETSGRGSDSSSRLRTLPLRRMQLVSPPLAGTFGCVILSSMCWTIADSFIHRLGRLNTTSTPGHTARAFKTNTSRPTSAIRRHTLSQS